MALLMTSWPRLRTNANMPVECARHHPGAALGIVAAVVFSTWMTGCICVPTAAGNPEATARDPKERGP